MGYDFRGLRFGQLRLSLCEIILPFRDNGHSAGGSLRLTPVANVGNFAATISNIVGLGQASVYTLPDPANALARVLVGATATPFVSGNLPADLRQT